MKRSILPALPSEIPILEHATTVWAQPGITSLGAAHELLDALRSSDTLVMPSADGDVGYPLSAISHRRRGHGASVCANVIAASPPHDDLLAHHRALGLGPGRIYCPAVASSSTRLARLVLDDAPLLDRLRSDGALTRILVAFKDDDAARLADRLRLTPTYCAPDPAAYEAANDKLEFWRAGTRHGFATPPVEVADDETQLDGAFRRLATVYGAGCVLRLRRGAGGHRVQHVRSSSAARRCWRALRRHGEVLIVPFVPSTHVLRNVSAHGVVTASGFVPLVFADQLLRGFRFRGNVIGNDWSSAEVAAIGSALTRIAGWLRSVGFVGGIAGVDGLLVRGSGGPEFLALDPNARLTATIGPWAVVAALSERAGRAFVWQLESFRILGNALTVARLRRRLGGDLLDAARLDAGGVLPSSIALLGLGGLGASWMTAVLLAHDQEHLEHLRRRTRAALGGIG